MKRNIFRKALALGICGAGICAFSCLSLAQGNAEAVLPLDEAGAEMTALADAGVEEADAQRIRSMREREDGEDVIEVEFSYENNSYEYMLRESDGMILEWSIEGRSAGDATAELTLLAEDAAPGGDPSAEVQTEVLPEAGLSGEPAAADSGVRITADGTELIGYEQAMQIVLEDSGIAAGDAEFSKIKFEYDGRYYDYEFELREGRTEYEYKLDAQTGDILEVERD